MSKRDSGFFGASILLLWLVTIIVLIPLDYFVNQGRGLTTIVVFMSLMSVLLVALWSIGMIPKKTSKNAT